MKKNLYFRAMFQRKNILKELLLTLFMEIASFPRLVLEVFIRKNMGRRYFRRSAAVISAIVIFIIPFVIKSMISSFDRYYEDDGFWSTIKSNWLYYLFFLAFCYFSYLRYKDVKHIASQFDMNHFSLSSGKTLPFFNSLKFKGRPFSARALEIYIEPLPFFLIGLFLYLINQHLFGIFLMFCSIVYSLSYAGAYMIGDNFVMDKIDEIICNEELSESFVSDEPSSRGFRFFGQKPTSEQLREDILNNTIISDDEDVFTEAV